MSICQRLGFAKSHQIWIATTVFIIFSSCGLASTRIDLNGEWQFKTDPAKSGEDQGWIRQIPAGTEIVHIPHTWNIGKYEDFEGTGWYFRAFEIPDELRAQRVELHFGAWHGPTSLLPAVFERIKHHYPTKTVVVSEFGTRGVIMRDSKEADNLRSHIHTEQMDLIGKQDWIAGALMWCYQDYRSHRNLWPGETAGYVDHGVVDENRQRRPS